MINETLLAGTLLASVKTVLGFAVVLGAFILIQGWVRRQSGCRDDQDPLEYMPHGCSNCNSRKSGNCKRFTTDGALRSHEGKKEDHHHELA
jgi:hypothetical protein